MDIVSLWSVLVIAVLVQTIWQAVKSLWQGGRLQVNRLGPLVLAVILALTSGINVFDVLGVPLRYVWLAAALTGVICSRGASVLHETIKRLSQLRVELSTPAGPPPAPPDVTLTE